MNAEIKAWIAKAAELEAEIDKIESECEEKIGNLYHQLMLHQRARPKRFPRHLRPAKRKDFRPGAIIWYTDTKKWCQVPSWLEAREYSLYKAFVEVEE